MTPPFLPLLWNSLIIIIATITAIAKVNTPSLHTFLVTLHSSHPVPRYRFLISRKEKKIMRIYRRLFTWNPPWPKRYCGDHPLLLFLFEMNKDTKNHNVIRSCKVGPLLLLLLLFSLHRPLYVFDRYPSNLWKDPCALVLLMWSSSPIRQTSSPHAPLRVMMTVSKMAMTWRYGKIHFSLPTPMESYEQCKNAIVAPLSCRFCHCFRKLLQREVFVKFQESALLQTPTGRMIHDTPESARHNIPFLLKIDFITVRVGPVTL